MTFDPKKPFDLNPLPPPISILNNPKALELMNAHNEALMAISQLEGALRDLDMPEMFLSTFYLNESISSNAVENIHPTIESVLEDETKPAREHCSGRDWSFVETVYCESPARKIESDLSAIRRI